MVPSYFHKLSHTSVENIGHAITTIIVVPHCMVSILVSVDELLTLLFVSSPPSARREKFYKAAASRCLQNGKAQRELLLLTGKPNGMVSWTFPMTSLRESFLSMR